MTTSYDDWAYDQFMAELGHEEELRRAIDDISIDNASYYLGTFLGMPWRVVFEV